MDAVNLAFMAKPDTFMGMTLVKMGEEGKTTSGTKSLELELDLVNYYSDDQDHEDKLDRVMTDEGKKEGEADEAIYAALKAPKAPYQLYKAKGKATDVYVMTVRRKAFCSKPILAWFLPYAPNKFNETTIPAKYKYFFTHELSGCGFAYTVGSKTPVVAHLDGKWKNNAAMQAWATEKGLKLYCAADYNPDNLAGDGKATVFGVKDAKGIWSFYAQERVIGAKNTWTIGAGSQPKALA